MKISEQQLERLIDTYQNLVYSVCFKITGNHFDAQDMAQETFYLPSGILKLLTEQMKRHGFAELRRTSVWT